MFGTPGQVDYCSANAFLDVYAHELRAKGVNAISINWDGWQEVGMAANIKLPESMRATYLKELQANGILPTEGIEAFMRILAHPLPQVIISTSDWNLRFQPQETENIGEPKHLEDDNETSEHTRPELTTEYVAPRTSTEQKIADIWQLLLGIDSIGIYDDFFELGGHSLLMTQLISRIQESFSVSLEMHTLFEAPTIAASSEEIDNIQTMRQQLQAPKNQTSDEMEEMEI